MNGTPIQWADDTVNPVMGCEGCELWPTVAQIQGGLICLVLRFSESPRNKVRSRVATLVEKFQTSTELRHGVAGLIRDLSSSFPEVPMEVWHPAIMEHYRCYAGELHFMRGARPSDYLTPVTKGYAKIFERPEQFPGRMTKEAGHSDLRGTERPDKPWLNGMPRLIFVSDMGDALSKSIGFEFLKTEIIDHVASPKGSRHIWLWLTKRPDRMEEFAAWLFATHNITWPDNLVAMTSVTNRATRSRIGQLRKVPAKLRGLSVEPLVESVDLDLSGIDWLIVGGESGTYAPEFDLQWVRSLKVQCRDAGVAFFVKQLGANPVDDGFPIPLRHAHGGDWDEWPEDLRIRNQPDGFRYLYP